MERPAGASVRDRIDVCGKPLHARHRGDAPSAQTGQPNGHCGDGTIDSLLVEGSLTTI